MSQWGKERQIIDCVNVTVEIIHPCHLAIIVDIGRVVREVWWMGGCLFQGTDRCGVWMVDVLYLFS